jgi:N-acetylglucosamine kinase-like BadF-type ATPase
MEDYIMYVLGIDGGGTKTTGIITDLNGRVFASETVGATNPNNVNKEEVEENLRNLITSLKRQNVDAFNNLSSVFAGMSGADNKVAHLFLYKTMCSFFPKNVQINVDNDAVNALFSGTLGKSGIVQIAGTGSITFGINDQGVRGRVGGWGYLLDDAGSGYALGRDALKAVFDAYDNCSKKTTLTQLVLQHFNLRSPPELISYIYEKGMATKVISPLSQLVFQAAEQGDEVAFEIILHAGKKMGNAISCLVKKLFSNEVLGQEQSIVTIVLSGGVFRRADLFIPVIQNELAQHAISAQFIKPQIAPVGGAVAAALINLGKQVHDAFVEQLLKDGISA